MNDEPNLNKNIFNKTNSNGNKLSEGSTPKNDFNLANCEVKSKGTNKSPEMSIISTKT